MACLYCSEAGTIVLLAIFDAITTLCMFGVFSILYLYKSFGAAFEDAFADDDEETYNGEQVGTTYKMVLALLILYIILNITLITAAIIKNKLCCWIWVVGTAGISLAIIIGSLCLIYLRAAIPMSLWILGFKTFSIFMVIKFAANIGKGGSIGNVPASVQSSPVEFHPQLVYAIPQQQFVGVDPESQKITNNDSTEKGDEIDGAPPPSYTALFEEAEGNLVNQTS